MAVYDEEKVKKPGSHDDLDMSDDDRAKEIADLERDYSAPAMDSDALQSAEQEGAESPNSKGDSTEASQLDNALDQIGPGFKQEEATGIRRFESTLNGLNRRRVLLGGGITAGVVSIIVTIMMSLIPLKLVHIVENLQNKFFSTSESAVEKYTQKLLQKYVSEHVLTAMNKPGCTSTRINKDCVDNIVGEGKVEKLFRAWREDKLENKLATKYGIEFEKRGTNYYLKAPGVGEAVLKSAPGQIPIFDINDMPQASRATIRAKITEALDGETKFRRVMYRFKVGHLLERKYGIKRCMFACDGRDKIADWADKKQEAAKLQVIRRVVEPHSDMLGFAFSCIVSSGCNDAPSSADGNDNERRDKLEQQVRDYLEKRGQQYTEDTVQKIADASIKISENGLMNYIIETVLNKEIADAASKTVPVVGWIHTIANIIETTASAGPKIKRWAFVLNSTAMVSYYMLARSHADEQKAGDTTADLTGSFVNMLGNNTKNGESAENSPLYSNLMGSSSQKTAFDSLLPSAFAAAPASEAGHYTCDNGSLIPVGKLICPEESLLVSNFLTELSNLFNNGPLAPLKFLADQWNNSAGWVWDKAQGLAGSAIDLLLKPFGFILDPLKEWMGAKAQEVFTAVATYFIPSPISDNMSGARSFNMLAGGADAAGSSYAQYGLGGKRLSTATVMQIQSEQEAQRKMKFQSQPFFARMFDTNSSYSMVSQLAMAMPISQTAAIQHSFAGLINPFSKMFSMFGTNRVAAASQDDPFGIPQYGYDPNGAAVNTDPSTLTESYCAQKNKDWANDVSIDPDTGMDVHNSENPCLLLDAAVGSAGAIFDDSLLPAEELGTPTGGSGPSTGNTGTDIVGDMFADSTNVPCAYGTTPIAQPQEGYHDGVKVMIRLCALPNLKSSSEESQPGGKWYVEGANGQALVNSRVSGAWFALVQAANAAGVGLHAESSFRTNAHQTDLCGGTCDGSFVARPGYSPHQMGLAIDFSGTHLKGTSSTSCSGRARDPSSPVWTWLYNNAETYHIKQYSNESWHWDPLDTPSRCGTGQ